MENCWENWQTLVDLLLVSVIVALSEQNGDQQMARRTRNPISRAMDYAIMTGDVDGAIAALQKHQDAVEAARIARGPTEADIKLARMRRARGMSYSKWALGEKED